MHRTYQTTSNIKHMYAREVDDGLRLSETSIVYRRSELVSKWVFEGLQL